MRVALAAAPMLDTAFAARRLVSFSATPLPAMTRAMAPPIPRADAHTPLTTRRLPAWLLSIVVHLALLLVLALAVRPQQTPSLPTEKHRPAGIVLASTNELRQVEYFDADDAPRDNQPPSDVQSASAEPSSDARNRLAAALPSPEQSAARLPIAPLPQLPGVPPGDVEAPSLRVTPLRKQPLFTGADDEAILAEEAVRRASVGSSGPQIGLSIFGSKQAVGNSFVFVIDRSKSMGSEGLGALDAAQRELAAALERLEPAHRFQVIAYHQRPVYVGARRLLDATPENKQALQQFFDELVAYGGTQHETALLAALRLEPDVIFLLTDGGDPYLSEGQIDLITRRADGRTTIHCLQFGFGAAPQGGGFMQRLATRNRGSYGYVNMSARRAP